MYVCLSIDPQCPMCAEWGGRGICKERLKCNWCVRVRVVVWSVCNKKVSVKGSRLSEFLLDKKWRARAVDRGGIRCTMCNVPDLCVGMCTLLYTNYLEGWGGGGFHNWRPFMCVGFDRPLRIKGVFYDFCDCGRVLSDLYVYIEREGREGWDDYWNLYVKGRGNISVLH